MLPTGATAGYYGLLLAFVLALFLPLLRSDPIESRDHVDHYLRIEQYARELTAGRWPQILPDPVRGGGHAFPRYYPPLSHLAVVPTFLLIGDSVGATHATAVAGVLLAAIAMLILLGALGTPPPAAMLGALTYATMPYQFVLLFVRGAFAESLAMIWYPLLLLGVWRLATQHRLPRWWPVVLAALVLTHTAVALWAIPLLGLVGSLALAGTGWHGMVRGVATGGLLAAGFGACYLLPMLAGLGTVRASDPQVMFTWPTDLAQSMARAGARTSMAVLAIGLGLGGLVSSWRLRHSEDFTRRLVAASLIGIGLVVGMMLAPLPVWQRVPSVFRYIQFPWRLMGLLALFTSMALGLAASRFDTARGRLLVWVSLMVLGVAAVVNATIHARQVPHVPRDLVQMLMATTYADRGLTFQGDYLPRGIEPATLARNVEHARGALLGAAGPEGWQRDRHGATARITLEAPAQVLLPLTGYTDLWVVRDARSGVTVATTSVEGQLAVTLDAGEHRLDITQRLPWPTRAGIAISILALIVCLRAPAIRS